MNKELCKGLFELGTQLDIINDGEHCPNDTASFTCTNEGGNYIAWAIRSERRGFFSQILSYNNPKGFMYSQSYKRSSILVEIEFSNSTFITSIMTIVGVTALAGHTIFCNGERETISSTDIDTTIGKCCTKTH